MRHVLVALALISASPAFARRQNVSAEGQAVVAAGGKALARSQAINVALRRAVAQVVTQLGGPSEGDDAATDKNVYGRAAAYVPSSTVVSENLDGSILTVEISAEVEVEPLLAALGGRRGAREARARSGGGAAQDLGGKRVIILATEQLGPHQIFGWTDYAFHVSRHSVSAASKTTMVKVNNEMGGIESVMSEGFSSAGFDVIDPAVLKGKLAPKPAMSVLDLSNGEARNIAEKGDADLVVVAKGVAKDAQHATLAAGGMRSGQGNVVARLIRVKDGKVLASSTQHAAQIHIDLETARLNALNEAARLAAAELTKKISAE